ncbi:hypothetical protein BCR44DRAFT_1497140 [Catenaria anguillulae PL171]|uniref:Uncharacterized protein n=1 Tax=Catenaria anguillulae PL171 TaxID=765915 RepID=A0A1Y2HXQ4_9FUNG|nr:hypothetical protein BCR44DRAFT_1497140 [Catenaria anguillulae PL171]
MYSSTPSASRPTSSGSAPRRSSSTAGARPHQSPASSPAVLMNATEIAFNNKLDGEIRALKKNFIEAMSQARLGGKDRLVHSADEVQLQHRALSILKSAHSLTAQTRQLKEILLLGDTAARHALLAQRASTVTDAHAKNYDLLVALAQEATEAAAELDACLWEHCDPLPDLSASDAHTVTLGGAVGSEEEQESKAEDVEMGSGA